MSIELFPRLYKPMAEVCWNEFKDQDLNELSKSSSLEHPMEIQGETGGIPVVKDRLDDIRKSIVEIACLSGYPNKANSSVFDAKCSRFLIEQASIPDVEAYRDEVWSFITLVLLPDIAAWRFSKRLKERMLGGVRNTFQRLWLRGRLIAVGDDVHSPDWELISLMSEDAFVAIIERPSLSARPLLAREFAETWRRYSKVYQGNMQSIHRIASRNLMAAKTVINFDALDLQQLKKLINNKFEQAISEAEVSKE